MRTFPLILLLVVAPAFAAPWASVELQAAAQVAPGPLVLGQVARIHSDDLDLMRKLVRLPVAADSAGVVDRGTVAALVAKHLRPQDGEVAWSGAEMVRMAAALDAQAVVQTATQAVADLLQARGVAAEIRVRHSPGAQGWAAEGTRLQARALDHLPLRRSMVAWVDVMDGERVLRTIPVTFDLGWKAGEPAQAAPATSKAVAERADRGFPMVARGDWATLRAGTGSILLESRVEVLQDGRTGDRIRVRQPGGGGMVFARVLGTGRLELTP